MPLIRIRPSLSVILVAALLSLCAPLVAQVKHEMTVLHIDDQKIPGCQQIVFARSQRFYSLPDTAGKFSHALTNAQWSLKTHKPVLVIRNSETDATITDIQRISRKKRGH
jgi:hypothetical protein